MTDLSNARTPIFELLLNGLPFHPTKVLSIEVTDGAGFESDELVIKCMDAPRINAPAQSDEFQLSLGYLEWGAPFYIGTFFYEESERIGFDREVTFTAKAADHSKTLKEPKTRAWEGTFGGIADQVAKDHGLKLSMAETLKNHPIGYVAQTEESDQNFLTRLGRKVGAVTTFKDGFLLITERGSGKTASGKDLPPVIILPQHLNADEGFTVRLKPRAKFSKVISRWQDRAAGTIQKLTLETGGEGPSMTLREVFQSEAEARSNGEAKVKELRAGEGELTLNMIGNPLIRAESPIQPSGVDPDADQTWIAKSVTHVWDFAEDGGTSTTVDADFGMEDKGKKKKNAGKSSSTKNGNYVSILDR
ncbi:Phage protein D [Aliiroseovarius crassostreae]|uniref:Late control protein n=1 Tax=Aliiroseovarius crassostreae TaxID=154981 RepID=A0A0P7IJT9_9RHOB|nr:contractile injection system protein, VgrG/Pvc8 family [Aliiroseovarius crassostreae]KPN64238.1 hypothetical protein AKJ29_16515 [Aliiroseovarius crassostreae]SFU30702.1 Phage protein D [Aliiroseovarius crassostreae]